MVPSVPGYTACRAKPRTLHSHSIAAGALRYRSPQITVLRVWLFSLIPQVCQSSGEMYCKNRKGPNEKRENGFLKRPFSREPAPAPAATADGLAIPGTTC